ncbi:MAG: hypothetical protein PHY93_10920 [Bacteriovorax sp.]|nr:hypothetical protein [Bacteriovorax sp.]
MAFKKFLISALVLFSVGAQAIPPIPPSSIYNKIRTMAARNCVTENDMKVSELKDAGTIKFVLELNNEGSGGILTMTENGFPVESFNVNCN